MNFILAVVIHTAIIVPLMVILQVFVRTRFGLTPVPKFFSDPLKAGNEIARWDLVQRRLSAYAEMKGEENNKKLLFDLPLSPRQHGILLGALKKIEAKNAVLGAVVFFGTALAAGAFLNSEDGEFVEAQMLLFNLMFIIAILLIVGRIDGAAHLGQRHANAIAMKTRSEQCLASNMQRALVQNLLEKEAGFALSILLIVFTIIAAMFLFPAANVFPSMSRPSLAICSSHLLHKGQDKFWADNCRSKFP